MSSGGGEKLGGGGYGGGDCNSSAQHLAPDRDSGAHARHSCPGFHLDDLTVMNPPTPPTWHCVCVHTILPLRLQPLAYVTI